MYAPRRRLTRIDAVSTVNLLYLGFEGYRRVALNDLKNARLLARALERSKCASPSLAPSVSEPPWLTRGRPWIDYKVVSEVHHLKEDRSLTEKAKETVGAVDDVGASALHLNCRRGAGSLS